ncbi:DUF6655 family protein [Planctomicrobium piriforme]|uniref:Uncharacterized protein n=1 Tax=Planctomicrobium piriforme TaxID=1576369 RepID=A0A1I3MKX4_9PLAN|nr:DUF6655 family protein [Planctomicrobium piriforme]SFI97677.1 hypothetical protein SAMN05421753_11439 [Planctomicrobium piriforme]
MTCDSLLPNPSSARPLSGHAARYGALFLLALTALGVGLTGCGTTKQNMATEQMLNSDAVDAAVAKIDFTPLAGHEVYFETKYMTSYKGTGFVNSDYVISSLRQQMAAAGLHLQDTADTADFILEGRVGTLGADAHEVVYGIPSNSAISSAASVAATAATGVAAAPTMPELSLARRNEQAAAAKIGIFAYDKQTRDVVWQSGSSVAKATAKDLWVFGIGPFQRGTIYEGKVRFAGETADAPIAGNREGINGPIAAYTQEHVYRTPERKQHPEIMQASGESSEPLPAGGWVSRTEGAGSWSGSGVIPASGQSVEPIEQGVRKTEPPRLEKPY